eukprot:SAG31_NODE_2754_length_5137_cov_2.875645_3_plen_293_part_00
MAAEKAMKEQLAVLRPDLWDKQKKRYLAAVADTTQLKARLLAAERRASAAEEQAAAVIARLEVAGAQILTQAEQLEQSESTMKAMENAMAAMERAAGLSTFLETHNAALSAYRSAATQSDLRPTSLPIGTAVEVWSVSRKCWVAGTVVEQAVDAVSVQYADRTKIFDWTGDPALLSALRLPVHCNSKADGPPQVIVQKGRSGTADAFISSAGAAAAAAADRRGETAVLDGVDDVSALADELRELNTPNRGDAGEKRRSLVPRNSTQHATKRAEMFAAVRWADDTMSHESDVA